MKTPFVVVDGDRRMRPESPMLYSGVDIVVAPAGTLAEDSALRHWVEAGGIVVVPGAPEPGSRVLTVLAGKPSAFDQPLGGGRIVYAGSVKTLSPQAWREILEACATDSAVLARMRATEGYYDMLSYSGFGANAPRPPTADVLARFLGLYIVMLVPVNYLVLRRIRRKELAWVTIPALVAVFSIAAYFMGAGRMGKGLAVRRMSVAVTAANSRTADWTGRALVFSPSKKRYAIEFGGRDMSATDIRGDFDQSPFPPLEVVEDQDALRLPATEIYMWSTRRFVLNGIADLGGQVTARLVTDGATLSGTIRNDLPFELKDCALYGDRLVHKIGDLKPGQVVSVSSRLKEPPVKRSSRSVYRDPEKQTARERLESLFSGSLSRARLGSMEIAMLAWVDDPPYTMKVDGRGRSSDNASALIIGIRPEWRADSTGRIAGMLPAESSLLQPRGTSRYDRILRYRLPLDGTRLVLRKASVISAAFAAHLDARESSMANRTPLPGYIEARVYDRRTDEWRPIGRTETCGPMTFKIPDAQAVLGPGSIVSIKVSQTLDRSDFTFKPFRLSFEGRVK